MDNGEIEIVVRNAFARAGIEPSDEEVSYFVGRYPGLTADIAAMYRLPDDPGRDGILRFVAEEIHGR